MSKEKKYGRRSFLSAATFILGATEFSAAGIANSNWFNSPQPKIMRPSINPKESFGPIKQIDAGVLNIGYVDNGPPQGPAVILLHGWPYDIYSYAEVSPILTAAGYRVIVPFLRGYGTTKFISQTAKRNGQPSALALDTIKLMDALKIEKCILGGFDWGARTANIVAALWPERTKAMVSVSGYLISNRDAGKIPLPPSAEIQWWYQFYFATERGRDGYSKYTSESGSR